MNKSNFGFYSHSTLSELGNVLKISPPRIVIRGYLRSIPSELGKILCYYFIRTGRMNFSIELISPQLPSIRRRLNPIHPNIQIGFGSVIG